MDDQVCARCKTTKYRNPSLKLMVNVCGHTLCESCVDLLFLKGTPNYKFYIWIQTKLMYTYKVLDRVLNAMSLFVEVILESKCLKIPWWKKRLTYEEKFYDFITKK